MRVDLEKIRLGITPLTEECYAGVLKSDDEWKHKINVHNDFIHAVINCWKNKKQIVTTPDGTKYEIQVKQLNP